MKKRVALEDFYRYQYLSAVRISPDGSRAVFVRTEANVAENGYSSYLYLFDWETGALAQLTDTGRDKAPLWLDNGTLLFQSTRSEELKKRTENGEPWSYFYTMPASGGEAAEAFRIPAKVFALWPLADGRFLVKCERNNNYPGLHQAEGPEKEEALRLQKENEDYLVADELPFRHDGEGFYNNLRKSLALFDPAAGKLEFISAPLADVEHVALEGDQVLYSAHEIVKERRMRYPTGLYTYSLKTGAAAQLLEETTYRIRTCGYIGGQVVFAGSDLKRYGNQENPWFYVLRDGKPQVFAQNEESAMNSVGSDCRYGGGLTYKVRQDGIYFLSTMGGDAVVKRAGMDGRVETLSRRDGTVDCFDVGPRGIACVAMKNYRLQELYTICGEKEEKRSSFNDWVFEELAISLPQRVEFENCGCAMEGWVILPAGFDPAKTYPGILDIHGGHKCAYGAVYYHEMQLWASQGYFVFFCNPRGSDGGGNAFAEIIGRYGEIDYDDIMKFTDTVLERYPQLDKNRLGVTGGSYGGYMTNWIIGHTDRFRCAASQRSIASYISMFGTSDTGYSFPMYGFTTSLWEDPGRYWSHSPLKYADRVKTPTLFLHSENDYRCPISEGMQMFTALKFHGVEARLCMFKGECHELSRAGKPLHRARRLKEITDWMDGHLKGE